MIRMVSKHFSEHEYECRCGCGHIIVFPPLVGLLEAIRARFDKPINVNSINRCTKHNHEVGGSSKSLHIIGMAADIYIDGVSLDSLAREAERVGADGIGIYHKQNFVHVDVGGKRARWTDI